MRVYFTAERRSDYKEMLSFAVYPLHRNTDIFRYGALLYKYSVNERLAVFVDFYNAAFFPIAVFAFGKAIDYSAAGRFSNFKFFCFFPFAFAAEVG